ncbi:putative ATP-binding protein involved in virulence [Cyclonatronum proteinivorum]|uniref:Putative ATP-binding protein involved in virulence n=1 Tax=Cyclonatronum proteinivorum TaxID=1457365 RepID=A0A345UHL8_9BACT|nr:AAA family ATPase [Cyclonatronum proteinivorum]AXI99969.1 putative ATP-binding protein involved in virulence [Cyclonatronum proteinivorum]
MKIKQATIRNFKGIQELSLNLNDQLNIFIGDNGSGKTAVLEALLIAAGSLFIGVRDVSTKGIANDEIAYRNEEYQFPVEIIAEGVVNNASIQWSRERNTRKGSTTKKNASAISMMGKRLDVAIRKGEKVKLPLISYFSTGRLFLIAQDRQRKDKASAKPKEIGSRLRGYREAFDAKSNFRRFTEWFRLKEMSQIQRNEQDLTLNLIKTAITEALPGCRKIIYDLDPDTGRGLTLEFEDGRVLPFNYLSDGYRSFLAMIADIAHRCVLLNPYLGEEALKETQGIIFIDELDLHLHPAWQKIIVTSLLQTFPKIQFIATTHSPFLIQETDLGQLFILENCKLKNVKGASELSIEDIAEFIQGVEMPQWSTKKTELFEMAKDVYRDLDAGKVLSETDAMKLAERIRPFSQNPAFDAFIEQEKLKNAGK